VVPVSQLKSPRRRRVALAIATAGLLISGLVGPTAPANASTVSAVGGPITRSEILARAQYWLGRGDTWYSQSQGDAKPDGDGNSYRPDCSGFISMVWHLAKRSNGWDLDTSAFAAGIGSRWDVVPGGLDGLLPGDALLKSGHIELFDRWIDPSNHVRGAWTYAENNYGQKLNHHTVAGTSGAWGLTAYQPIRYRNVVGDAPVTLADGQFLREPSGLIALVVGGAAYKLSAGDYASIGAPTYLDVTAGSVATLPTTPRDGTYVRTTDGSIYVLAGGAKYRLSGVEYGALGNPAFVTVPTRLTDGYGAVPGSNTFLRNPVDGAIYQVIGGAKYKLSLDEYNALQSPAFTNVPVGFVDSINQAVPQGQLFLRDPLTGAIFQVVDGVRYFLSQADWGRLGKPAAINAPAGFIDSIPAASFR
jgi:hypothetical protein